nr:hypothetical protein ART_00063 [Achromobacter phage vB_Ade_ART]
MPAGLQTWDQYGRSTCDLTDRIGRLTAAFDVGGYNQVYQYTIPGNVEVNSFQAYSLMVDSVGGSMYGYEPPTLSWSGRTLTVVTSPLTVLPAAVWRIIVVLF